ncbi:MAG: LysR family transcriptional regulator [Proteobacteria bacterium]|nr:LysR family transcriptional regulator [Pseudomonadota bacterium]
MNQRQLEIFNAIIDCGTLTGAADLLRTSQPTVSRTLTSLEKDIGFSLFERQKGRVVPTAEGIALYEEMQRVFTGIGRLTAFAKRVREQRNGEINISVTPAIALSFMPEVINRFRQKNPDFKAVISVRAPSVIFNKLRNGTTDIAFSNSMVNPGNATEIPLINAQFICAIPAAHPLAQKEIIRPPDLAGEDFIMMHPEKSFNWVGHEKFISEMPVKPNIIFSTQRSAIAYGMVAQGMGISVLEPFSARFWEKHDIVIRPFRPALTYPFMVFFPRGKIRSDLCQRFAQEAMNHLVENPLPFQET